MKVRLEIDCKEFEKKFISGEYITPERFKEILDSHMEAIENNSNLCGMGSPYTKRELSAEEYFWLKQNHPECAEYYKIK